MSVPTRHPRELGRRVGRAQVAEIPGWADMGQDDVDAWFRGVPAGRAAPSLRAADGRGHGVTRSKTAARAWPPPMHIVSRP